MSRKKLLAIFTKHILFSVTETVFSNVIIVNLTEHPDTL